ncbi:MAG: hypothetical protein OXU71_02255 [Gammaproteobacteria bacterium]|nr:hypothetical protein [Gammaproteobacteria bacterium]
MSAAFFLGYDPGGVNKHGIAQARICANGTFDGAPETRALENAKAVSAWVDDCMEREKVTALGIDTMLAWSVTGKRACDDALKKQYPSHSRSVIHQNSLYSAMTVNGAMVAMKAQTFGIPLCESHPKLLLRILDLGDIANRELFERFNMAKLKNDHAADALVAAWCAAQWHFKRWSIDLYDEAREALCFYAGCAVYPWPESLGADHARRPSTALMSTTPATTSSSRR